MNQLYHIKTAIFDMDGLMFDTERSSSQSWLKAAKKLGVGIKDCMILEKGKMERTKMTVKEMRESLGMTLEHFSKRFGIPVKMLEDWESGARVPADYVLGMLKSAVENEKKERMQMN